MAEGRGARNNRNTGPAEWPISQGGSVSRDGLPLSRKCFNIMMTTVDTTSRPGPAVMTDELRLHMLRVLGEHPDLSQRELAHALGLSLGKTNYCVRALIARGWVKVNNFRSSDNKRAYAYVLTASGLQAKFAAATRFLQQRQNEYQRLEHEIELLRGEVARGAAQQPTRLGATDA